ncbi:hypothetical protein J0H33_01630 [bacterium]|nr:hypothetical protein [bacterium]
MLFSTIFSDVSGCYFTSLASLFEELIDDEHRQHGCGAEELPVVRDEGVCIGFGRG